MVPLNHHGGVTLVNPVCRIVCSLCVVWWTVELGSSIAASLMGQARGHLVFVGEVVEPQLPQNFCLLRSTRNAGFASGVEFAVVCSTLSIAA